MSSLGKELSTAFLEVLEATKGGGTTDIVCTEGGEVPANGKMVISMDLVIAVPKGTYGWIAPYSGLAAKHYIQVGAGVIDHDYRGHIKVVLFNHSTMPFQFEKGDRIAQLILEKIDQSKAVKVRNLDDMR